MRVNVVLIDYENVQPSDAGFLDSAHFRVVLFVGPKQKISVEMAQVFQKMGDRAEYVQLSGQGPNALDLHISYYIGKISATDPTAYFHIVSKDKGFDPLVTHLKSQNIFANRITSIGEIPIAKLANVKSEADRVAFVSADLKRRGVAKPRTVKTLNSTIISIFQKSITEKEATAVIAGLQAKGIVKIDAQKVSYQLD